MDGVKLGLGVVAALGAAGVARQRFGSGAMELSGPWQGSRNDDDEVRAQLVARPEQRRQVARRRSQLPAVSDSQLHRVIVSRSDPLLGTSVQDAARSDPRLIDAAINQVLAAGFDEVMSGGQAPELPIQRDLYLLAMETMRQAGGGEITAEILASNRRENTDLILHASVSRWPSMMRRQVRQRWHLIEAAFGEAKRLALAAARATRGTPDNVAWRDYADELDHELVEFDRALAPMLGGPAPGRHRRLPRGHRLLPGE